MPDHPEIPEKPLRPWSPLSPVLANVIRTSARFVSVVLPDRYEIGTVIHVPLSVATPVMANIAYTELSVFNDTLKCPLMPDVLSSIEARNGEMSLPASSKSSI